MGKLAYLGITSPQALQADDEQFSINALFLLSLHNFGTKSQRQTLARHRSFYYDRTIKYAHALTHTRNIKAKAGRQADRRIHKHLTK